MNAFDPKKLPDFKGIGFSKIGHFKEVRSKIKELEKLNLKLARRHSRLEAIFNNMSDGVTILDRNLNVVFVNQVQQVMFPDTPLIGSKCFKAYYQKDHTCKNCPALKTITNAETLRGEMPIHEGKLTGRYLDWSTSPIKDARGRVDEVILLMRDITERKEYEYKLMRADRMAAIGFLAAGIAHEINNPLTSIAGFSEGLLKRLTRFGDALEPQARRSFKDYLQIINDEAYRCRDIIRNLQAFSSSSSDSFEAIAIDRIIEETLSLFRQHAKDNHIKIVYQNQLAAGQSSIRAKESQLKHLFLNLFNRAFKAMEQGGVLSVGAVNSGDQIEIRIADTASDLTESCRNTVFDPSCASAPAGGINAVDMSICYNIVQHHRGSIQLECLSEHQSALMLQFPALQTEG